MPDTAESAHQLLDALERCGVDAAAAEEAAAGIRRHRIAVIHWDEADFERIVLHAFALARARSVLERALAANPTAGDAAVIERFIAVIGEHVGRCRWPTEVRADDPVLLHALWRQHRSDLAAAERIGDPAARSARHARLQQEGNRILRSVLEPPPAGAVADEGAAVADHELAAGLSVAANRFARDVLEDELHRRHPSAYAFLAVIHGRSRAAALQRLLDLRPISSRGFGRSPTHSAAALAQLIANLAIARTVLGAERFSALTAGWNALDKIRLIGVLDPYPPGATIGGYHLAYAPEYSGAEMPPWLQEAAAGELPSERSADAGAYVLLEEQRAVGSFDRGARSRLEQQYVDFQNGLIGPNYDALGLMVAHAGDMTKLTAQTIVALLRQMLDAYRRVAAPAEAHAAAERCEALLAELDEAWRDLASAEELPPPLRQRVTRIGGPTAGPDTVHGLICFLHDSGNLAVERLLRAARADTSLAVGRIGGERTEEIRIARLDEAPILVRGVIRHRLVAAIVRAACRLPAPVPGTFVVVRNHLSYSVRLGEHRAELAANLEAPDDEGSVRLETFQGGVALAQQLRGAFIRRVLREVGMAVASRQEGLVDAVVTGVLNKDHGARSEAQIERALIVVLRMLWSLRELDYAMAYLFAREAGAGAHGERVAPERVDEFAGALARIFVAEGRIPFAYRGEGMPFDTYCEYTGPKLLRAFADYRAEAREGLRYRLYFTLNALCRRLGLAAVPAVGGGIGQAVIDDCFNRPVRAALARGELRIGARGRIERNPAYQPLKEITRAVIAGENEALRVAVLLQSSDLSLDFGVIGSIDQLTVLRAQLEVAPDEWLVVNGLADDENRTVLYAFARHVAATGAGRWLSIAQLRRQLRAAGYRVPARIRVPAFRKAVSHRLLVEQPRARSRLVGASVRGLLASLGDGSIRIGRVTFDRAYWANPRTRGGRVLLVPFTTPEDLEAIRAAEAVLVTSGGLLSHAGVTTREFAIPSLILPHAEWTRTAEGLSVRFEERYPGPARRTEEGFWVSDSVISETVTVHSGDVVLVWASQGLVSVIPMTDALLEPMHEMVLEVAAGHRSAAALEERLAELAAHGEASSAATPPVAEALAFVLAEALWDKRLAPSARAELLAIVRRACAGARPDARPDRAAKETAARVEALVRTVLDNALAEMEQLLGEAERAITAISAYWRASNNLAVVERAWAQTAALARSLWLPDPRTETLERRIERLRRHPRIALLRTSAHHEVEAFAGRPLTEAALPAIRKALRGLRWGASAFKRQQVLLVCTANVDRSPIAAALLKRMIEEEAIEGIDVVSRGVAAADGRPMSEIGRGLLLAEDGIDCATHRSRRIGAADVRAADLILAMERAHLQQLAAAHPDARDRMFLLTSYGGVGELGDIDDPADQGGDAYARVKRTLRLALAGALKRMRDEGILARAMAAHLRAAAEELARAKRGRIGASARAVVPLEEVDADAVELVGGKGANLGEIAQIVRRHGAEVPAALMVTTFAFERFLDENGLREPLARLATEIDALHAEYAHADAALHDRVVEASGRIRDLIGRGTLDAGAGLGREIMAALEACGLNEALLSVRSSGLQEDAEEAAFAGAAETYLCVSSAEVLHWIKSVWGSFWLTRAILYRSGRIAQQGLVKPAVVVQKMFESQVSGVMFTTDPVSGRDVIVVEAGYGLGEGVVSGLVDVDRYYVDKADGSVAAIHVGKKAFMVKQDAGGKGTSVVPVESALRDVPCLTERDIRVGIALAIEEHYAVSQDIEFAIADGKFCVLQTRPITTR